MGMPGLPELLLIFSVVVLLFGAKKIPKLFGAFGEGIKNFKKGVNTDAESDQENLDSEKGDAKKHALDEKQD